MALLTLLCKRIVNPLGFLLLLLLRGVRKGSLNQTSRGENIKKLLTLALLAGSLAIAAPAAEAKTAANSAPAADPQIRVQIGGRQNNRRLRHNRMVVRTITRIVGRGRNRFRETVRITRFANGRKTERVIRRERINW